MTAQRKLGKSANAGAGAAGAGCGTLLVLLVKNLSDSNPWKSWGLILAPWLAVLITALATWGKRKLIEYLERRETENALVRAKKTLEGGLANPWTSQEHKDELRRKWERLEQLVAESEVEVVLTSPVVSHSQPSRVVKRQRN